MEDVVLGYKRTVSFWRTKRLLLSLERALSALRQLGSKGMMPAPQLVPARVRGRLQQEENRKGRFSEG
jgi:hypothetical protein